jgi:hypothetical protein
MMDDILFYGNGFVFIYPLWPPPMWNEPFVNYVDVVRKVVGSTLCEVFEDKHDHPIYHMIFQLLFVIKKLDYKMINFLGKF